MRHQPFETWIIDQEPLDPAQAQALRSHLQDCESCRKLSTHWLEAHAHLLSVTTAVPTPGFTQRFRRSLAQRRYRQQQTQIRRTVLFFLGGSIVSLLALLAYLIIAVTPTGLFVTIFRSLTYTMVWLNHIQSTYLPLVQSLPILAQITLWVAISTGLCVFSLIWAIAIWRISTQGVPNQ